VKKIIGYGIAGDLLHPWHEATGVADITWPVVLACDLIHLRDKPAGVLLQTGRAPIHKENRVTISGVGGVVLCGGRSSRMGRPKLSLPFGPERMLERVVRILRSVVSPVVVVAAPDQDVPPLPDGVLLARDEPEGLGPLAGLAAGLGVLRPLVGSAFVSACDAPLLEPAFVRRLIELQGEFEIVVPRDGEFHHPLAAVYRTDLEDRVRSLLAADRRRPLFLIQECRSREVPVEELRCVDPALRSLRNTNTPEAYEAALREAGIARDAAAPAADVDVWRCGE
jgi:molybdenum cofactor guanylyltransferase